MGHKGHHLQTHPKPIKRIVDPLKRAVLQHCSYSFSSPVLATLTIPAGFYTRERVFFQDVSADSRFGPEATQTKLRSVICMPISNNRGQVYGALSLGNHYPFSQNHVSILLLLVRQASISIANALIFKSVQQERKPTYKRSSHNGRRWRKPGRVERTQ